KHPKARAFQRPDDRPHEGLVVEACRDQATCQLVDGAEIQAERGKTVLADGFEPVEYLDGGGGDIRLPNIAAEDGDQRVGLVDAGRQHAAWPVIFEGTAKQRLAGGKQGGSKRVAGVAGEWLAIE